jgi:sensor histidine kinase YesM
MPSDRSDARWSDAILLTVALQLFAILIFLPLILARHADSGWSSVVLDASTQFVTMGLALILFALFRKTLEWAALFRSMLLGTAVLVLAVSNAAFDLLYTGWVTQNLDESWARLPTNLSRGYRAAWNYILVLSVNLALFQIAFVRRRSARNERQLTDARTAAQQAQLQALRYQLNPHFLFNTLNSISSLIVTRRNEDAEQMTNKLSSFLRASLTCDPGGLIPLEEELSLIEEYLDIEAVRFGKRLEVQIACQPEAGAALIPGFLVQPLVENAIKHGVAPSRHPVTVRIEATLDAGQLCVKVINDKFANDEPSRMGGTGVGLLNVRQRLQAVFGDRASLDTKIDDHCYCAIICIPGVQARA